MRVSTLEKLERIRLVEGFQFSVQRPLVDVTSTSQGIRIIFSRV
jgi:hypothetical protein